VLRIAYLRIVVGVTDSLKRKRAQGSLQFESPVDQRFIVIADVCSENLANPITFVFVLESALYFGMKSVKKFADLAFLTQLLRRFVQISVLGVLRIGGGLTSWRRTGSNTPG
jgi:hypothetical protein